MRSGAGGALRALLEDPPLAARVLWREPMRAETMISEDRGLMARTFGTLFMLGGTFGLLLLVADDGVFRADWGAVAAIATAVALGALCFLLYTRIPRWGYHVMLIAATLIIGGLALTASDGASRLYLSFYAWVALVAGAFFAGRPAVAQVAFALAVMCAVMAVRSPPFAAEYVLAAGLVVVTSFLAVSLLRKRTEQLAADLADQAETDPLTTLVNRRGFNRRFELEVERAIRDRSCLSLIICDLDHFKAVNDELGHEQGDVALRRAADVIAESVRSVDAVSRLGGEEFAVLLPGATEGEALAVAERVRGGIHEEFEGHSVSLTASCGLASTAAADGDPRMLFTFADAALYQAKRAGRNCSMVYEPPAEGGPSEAASRTK